MISGTDSQQIAEANASGKPTVVFIHGAWLLAGSWDAWRDLFAQTGYSTVALSWPDDPASVEAARANPAAFAGKSIKQIAGHLEEAVQTLTRKPALIGHSFGGLMTQILAGRGLAAVSVAIDPAPFRGVLPLPVSALRSALPALGNPLNRGRAVTLSQKQFTYAFANAVSADEAADLYKKFHVAAPGRPVFQAALANINPWTEDKVDTHNPERGPLLVIDGERDNVVPWALANAAYKRQSANNSPTEIAKIPGRGHSLTIDSGWRDVADVALEFVKRYLPTAS